MDIKSKFYCITFLSQLSLKKICSSVWNQCSPSFITVRFAQCLSINLSTVWRDVRLSCSAYKISVGVFQFIGFARTKHRYSHDNVSPKSVVIELTGDIEKLRGFVNMMENYGVLEMAKTGVLAMSRGEKI